MDSTANSEENHEGLSEFNKRQLKSYKTTELLNEAQNIILKREISVQRDKLWTILDAPKGSYFGPPNLRNIPQVEYKKGITKNRSFHRAYCV